MSSLVFPLVLNPQLHTPCISSPNHHHLHHYHTTRAKRPSKSACKTCNNLWNTDVDRQPQTWSKQWIVFSTRLISRHIVDSLTFPGFPGQIPRRQLVTLVQQHITCQCIANKCVFSSCKCGTVRTILLCVVLLLLRTHRPPLSIDISCPRGTKQQTGCTLVQRSIDGTSRWMDTRLLHRPCSAYYKSNVNKRLTTYFESADANRLQWSSRISIDTLCILKHIQIWHQLSRKIWTLLTSVHNIPLVLTHIKNSSASGLQKWGIVCLQALSIFLP